MDGGYTPPKLTAHRHGFVEVENYGYPTGFWICSHEKCWFGHEFGKAWVTTEEAQQLEGKLCIGTDKEDYRRNH